jgi:dienelactone hydrolase
MAVLLGILKVLGVIVGVYIIYLLFVALYPGFSVPAQPLWGEKKKTDEKGFEPPRGRRDVSFKVKGTRVSAWLFLPEDLSSPVPCIVMGNGFGGTKGMILEQYAVRYREAGYAVLAFDYRHFGTSGGQPRQLISISKQLEDYEAAVEYARGLEEIDPLRIALWGTSASGGYGIVIAARDRNIGCVVAQCPGLDHKASEEMFRKNLGIRHMLRLVLHGQRDMMRHYLGLSPHKIPIVGKSGTLAFFPLLDAYGGYQRLVSENFVNEICPRFILRSHGYRPDKHLRDVRCPVLIQICEHDSLAPIRSETEDRLRERAEVKRYPIGHFDIYTGENFERAVGDQLDFIKKHL